MGSMNATAGSNYQNQGGSQQQSSNQTSSGFAQNTWAPHQAVAPIYGQMSQNLGVISQTPTPVFPGITYVPPSQLTQQSVDLRQGQIPHYQNAATASDIASGAYLGAGAAAKAAEPMFYDAGNAYAQAAGMAPGVANAYNQAMGQGQGVNAAYGQAAGMAPSVANAYGNSGNLALGAIGNQRGINSASLGNYNFLSNAADVANNPYVQDQLAANKSEVMEGLMREAIPQINAGAASVNNLGSSRQGLLQGQAVGDAAEALARVNASTMLDAYGKGLGAQQNALGYTSSMLENQLSPARSAGYAADQRARGMDAMSNAARLQHQGMGALGEAAGYGRQGMEAAGLGADYMRNRAYMGREAAAQAGQAGDYGSLAAQQLGNAGNYMGQGADAAAAGGQTVEDYQGRAQNDAIMRHDAPYTELWERMGRTGDFLTGLFQPLGTGSSTSYQQQAGNQSSRMRNSGYGMNDQVSFGGTK